MVRLLWLMAFTGCAASSPMHADLAELPDLLPLHLSAAATDGTVTLKNADFSVTGAGQAAIGAFNLSHGSGTIELGGHSVPAAVYQRQGFPSDNLLLYQTLAVESDRLWVLWFYCSTVDHTLQALYYENTAGTTVSVEAAFGTCQDADTTSTVAVQFPAIDLAPPPLIDGFTMEGAKLHLDGANPGTVDLGVPLTVFVFNTVDCTTTCGSPGWTELHALLWDQAAGRVCFGIFYLRVDDTTHVQLAYSLTLPSLTDPAGNIVLPATWKTP